MSLDAPASASGLNLRWTDRGSASGFLAGLAVAGEKARQRDPISTAGREQILEAVEREEILSALESAAGDTTAAAERLEISRPTLYRRLRSLKIELNGDG